ncbi:predicted protein [Thalassiosira pseudonana CCMP1335]|uniref:Uncharacterized protein n=1 Tax=Thalassiosira pseudonana TaxID=35128 RepID=B8C0V9_THAPS|nr:predicted protein [Thalassiosira pseudonana CCMP1335]EED92672.1 predicted protein [Thalassiosira pseudonana CCMP1335]
MALVIPTSPPSCSKRLFINGLLTAGILSFTIRQMILHIVFTDRSFNINTEGLSFLPSAPARAVIDAEEDNANVTKVSSSKQVGVGVSSSSHGPVLKTLIARTVSKSEAQNVVSDELHVRSFCKQHNYLKAMSLSNCNACEGDGGIYLNPYQFGGEGTSHYPNRVLCESVKNDDGENNYLNVQANFLLFAWDEDVIRNVTLSVGMNATNRIEGGKVDILDVSQNPSKTWNILTQLSEEVLEGYDYLWFIDGDVSLVSLNWQGFWMQHKLLKPKISQAALIGTNPMNRGTDHRILRPREDTRVLAAEVPIVEINNPLFEVGVWLGYRDLISKQSEILPLIEQGADYCLDVSWCHYAQNNAEGVQEVPPIGDILFEKNSPTLSLDSTASEAEKRPSCVVFYQSPMVHLNKQSMPKPSSFVRMNDRMCECRGFILYRLRPRLHHKLTDSFELCRQPITPRHLFSR